MKASFENFMTGLIDYAGLFPPASLDLDTALANYAGYLAGEDGWMLGRCVVPAIRLHRVGRDSAFRYSVVVGPGVLAEEYEQLAAFPGQVAMVETRLADGADSPEHIAGQLRQLETRLGQAGLWGVQLFVEAGNAAAAAPAIAAFNSRGDGGEGIASVGYKLRCGGADQQAVPTPARVAEVIGLCRSHDIPLKFTAGMHQPLRHYSAEIGTMQHGFINIFAAALLSWGGDLAGDERVRCLGDENVDHFRFTEEHFSWREKTIAASEVKRLRRSRAISFGSCSFAEPVAGLRALGFLDNAGD